MWTGSITDEAGAFRMAGSGRIGVNFLGMVDADFTSEATAIAAAISLTAAKGITDWCISDQCARGFKVATSYGAVYSGSKAAFFASLPTNTHQMRAITG